MKSGKYTIYQGKEYTSGKKSGKIVLRSTNIKDIEENGFKACEPFKICQEKENIVCMKFVEPSEVNNFYRLDTKAIYKGFKFDVLLEKDDEILIASLGSNINVGIRRGIIMLLPDNIRPENSIYYNGSIVLQELKIKDRQSVFDLYQRVKKINGMSFNCLRFNQEAIRLSE